MSIYTVEFERIGKAHPDPMTFDIGGPVNSWSDALSTAIQRKAQKYLRKKAVEVLVDLSTLTGNIVVDTFRPAGSFKIKGQALCPECNGIPTGHAMAISSEKTLRLCHGDDDERPTCFERHTNQFRKSNRRGTITIEDRDHG